MAYTYDDFVSAAEKAGLLGKFSQYDLDLAKKYPEFGLSILSLKQDYDAATTAEQRTLANEAANELRRSYGNYSGGADGSKYYADGVGTASQSSFVYPSAPEYENPYAEQQQALLDELLNREEFSWSKEEDPQWGSLKKSYLREGERASANALAQASAASGGRPSSFAVTAASQAGDYYATQLNDMIPTLYQQAYEKYLSDYNLKLQDLDTLNSQEQLVYNKYLAALDQYNTDRSFEYGVQRDELADQLQAEETAYARSLYEQESADEQAQAQRAMAQEQVDAILAAGGTPGAELVAASGYGNEYVQALAAAYRQAAAEAAAKENTYEPTLTWPQTQAAIEAGNTSPAVLQAYEYYMGAEYDAGAEETQWGEGYSTVRAAGARASEWDMVKQSLEATLREGRYDSAEAYLDQVAGKMSEEQWLEVVEILKKYGYTGLD